MFSGLLAAGIGTAHGEEGEIGAHIFWQQDQPSSSLFAVPEAFAPMPAKRMRQELYLHMQQGLLSFRGQVHATQQADGGYTDEKATINELYADFSLADLEGSIGKKVVNWGVGYGYRPLDVIQREPRQALRSFDLEGVPVLELAYFSAESAVTAVLANRLRFDGLTPQQGAYEGALKYSALLGSSDMHLLLYQREGEGVSIGGGASATHGEHLEWHASARYLASYTVPGMMNAAGFFTPERHRHGFLALLGASWTWESGYSLLLEAWHDDTA